MFNPAIASQNEASTAVSSFILSTQQTEKNIEQSRLLMHERAREEKVKRELIRSQKEKAKTERAAVGKTSSRGASKQEVGNVLLAMMMFFVGQMNDQNKMQIAGTQHLEVVSNNEVKAGEHLNNLNPKLTDDTHLGAATGFCIAGVILGNVLAIGLTIATFGAAFPLLIGAGVGDYFFFSHLSDVEKSVGDSGPSAAGLEQVSGEQQMYGMIGTLCNQEAQTDMQTDITQTAQNNASDANMYSQDLSTWSQVARISTR
jgi:hypothetical protein